MRQPKHTIKKRPLQPKGASLIFPKELYPANAHVSKPLAGAGNLRKRTMRKVDDSAAIERPAIIDTHDNAFAIGLVGHAHLGAEWERWVGSRKLGRSEALAAGSQIAVEAWAIPARDSARRSSLRCKWRKGTKSKGSGKDKTKHLLRESKE